MGAGARRDDGKILGMAMVMENNFEETKSL